MRILSFSVVSVLFRLDLGLRIPWIYFYGTPFLTPFQSKTKKGYKKGWISLKILENYQLFMKERVFQPLESVSKFILTSFSSQITLFGALLSSSYLPPPVRKVKKQRFGYLPHSIMPKNLDFFPSFSHLDVDEPLHLSILKLSEKWIPAVKSLHLDLQFKIFQNESSPSFDFWQRCVFDWGVKKIFKLITFLYHEIFLP